MKTAISIPDDLFRAAERLAKRLGVSRSELYRRAMRILLRDHEEDGITEALNEVYGDPAGRARVDPVLERIQCAALPRDEW